MIQIGLESPADHDIPRLYIGRKPATSRDVTRSLLDSILMHSKDGSTTRSYAPSEPEKSGICYPLWFGTNRKPVDPQDLCKGFGSQRADQLIVGRCEVSVPEWHKIGSLGSSWLRRFLSGHDDRLQLVSDSLRIRSRCFLGERSRSRPDEWRDQRGVNRSEGEAFIFLHGFNVTFEEAALRAAQLGCDLAIPGVTAFYSWPSRGEVAAIQPTKRPSRPASDTSPSSWRDFSSDPVPSG